jgi:hypothetical protein
MEGPLYASCVRLLLGVRRTTATDLCLIEAGLPPIEQMVRSAQKRTIEKFIAQRANLPDDPLMQALRIAREAGTPCAKYIQELSDYQSDADTVKLHNRIVNSMRTKYRVYYELINPNLEIHQMYRCNDVIEYKRLTATRLRLSSHNLEIERGRWSRKPREERLCSCGSVQDEQHMLDTCPSTQPIRAQFPSMNFHLPDFFVVNSVNDIVDVLYAMFHSYV